MRRHAAQVCTHAAPTHAAPPEALGPRGSQPRPRARKCAGNRPGGVPVQRHGKGPALGALGATRRRQAQVGTQTEKVGEPELARSWSTRVC
eukprot:1874326-Alexandrium_andersonii.AAC.1